MGAMTTLQVNGRTVTVAGAARSLLTALREDLGLYGAKFGCGHGQCGACVVLVDGEPRASCMMTVAEATGREVITIEGLAKAGALHPVQEAFVAEDALQCGFCTSGMILSAAALLVRNAAPTEDEIREALVGHLCRCGVYGRVVRAVQRAGKGAR